MNKQGKKMDYIFKVGVKEPNLYRDDKRSIRITEGLTHWKKLVAKSIASYLNAPSRPWDTTLRKDKNAEALCAHLNSVYPEFEGGWGFRTLGSQDRFDVVCLAAGVAIEIKSVKSNNRHIVANATVYPDVITVRKALPDSFSYPVNMKSAKLNEQFDVLVVCVNQTEEIVTGFAIVDGNYWAITEDIFDGCIDYYRQLNDLTDEINKTLAPTNSFARGMRDGTFGEGVKLNLRKLIFLTNPVGRLNVPGVFDFYRV